MDVVHFPLEVGLAILMIFRRSSEFVDPINSRTISPVLLFVHTGPPDFADDSSVQGSTDIFHCLLVYRWTD